jgi:hypothetical protein
VTGHHLSNGGAICLEGSGALCRAQWPAHCECEVYYQIRQLADGSWTHSGDGSDGFMGCRSVGWIEGTQCNICHWINWSVWDTIGYQGERWLYAYGDHELPDGAIEVEWTGDEYLWQYADPRALGKLIGRCVVAAWEDDLEVS